MCVIINKPSDILIDSDILSKCWEANPHGAGFMYVSFSKLIVKKGLMTYNAFYNEFKKVDQRKHIVIHFRLASYGSVVSEQTHPMFIRPDLAFVHNGHMLNRYIKESTTSNQSDTMIFNEKILQKLPNNFLEMPAITELISDYIKGSVMLFLDDKDRVVILGDESDSCVVNGSWFSNDFWDNNLEDEKSLYGNNKSGETFFDDIG